MTAEETNAAVAAAREMLFSVAHEHSDDCQCPPCRCWLALVEADPVASEAYARAYDANFTPKACAGIK